MENNKKEESKFDNLLFKTLLIVIPITLFVLIYSWSVSALGDYVYTITAKPFLVQTEVTFTHKKLTTKGLQIEYTVLKVPPVSKTVAKK